jgi:glycosyltransferase involved in cell wall biosynthesis
LALISYYGQNFIEKNSYFMKVMFVNVDDEMFLKQRLNLALAIQKSGFEVIVASEMTNLHKKISEYGFKYVDTGIKREGKNVFKQISSIYRLYRLFRDEKPDIVHNISIKPVIYGSIAARLSGVKKIVNLVNGLGYVFTEDRSFKRLALRVIVTFMYRITFSSKRIKVIFQNPDDQKFFISKGITTKENSFLILGSGVDTSFFSPNIEKPTNVKPRVLYFGRMLWDKGIEYLVEAKKILKGSGVDFDLILVGKPDESNPSHIKLKQLKKWESEGLIQFLGYRSDIIELIRECDLVVLPTYYREGVPLSLIEAASVGKPIVTTDMPGCREIVVDGFNGFIVPVKDSISLAEKIQEILSNKDMRISFGKNSRQRVIDLFAIETVAKKTIDIYKQN